MANYVITIGREFGSCGYAIGLKLGEMLGIPVYHKDLLEMAAKELKMDVKELIDIDETYSVRLSSYLVAKNAPPVSLQDRLFHVEKDIIRRLARNESCIIIGHCASYILSDMNNIMSVYIYAPDDVRYKYLLDTYDLTKEATKDMMKEVDNARYNYYRHYSKENRDSKDYKHIMMDSSLLGVEGTARAIKEIVALKFSLD